MSTIISLLKSGGTALLLKIVKAASPIIFSDLKTLVAKWQEACYKTDNKVDDYIADLVYTCVCALADSEEAKTDVEVK